MKTRDVTQIAIFLAITIMIGFFSLPLPFLPGLPIILQNVVIIMSGPLLGKKKSVIMVAIFLLLCALGFPVLAGGRGGIAIFASPSVGYFLGYLLCPFILGYLQETKHITKATTFMLLFILIGAIGINLCGAISLAYYNQVGYFTGVKMTFPFIFVDSLKSIVAGPVTARLLQTDYFQI